MLHALSFDVEELYHAELVRTHVAPQQRVSQAEAATEPILDLLARRKVRATFFIVGDVLREQPQLVRTIASAGHEIACHGMSHRPLWSLTPEEFRAELREFKALWAEVMPGGAPLCGFRAPTFSLVPRTSWALAVLAGEEFTYDSSIFPVANYVYGLNGGPLAAYRPLLSDLRRSDPSGPIVELPMTAWQVAGLRLPVSGGFYLRALPMPLLLHALRQVARTRPIVLYLHPWEAYGGTPVVGGLPFTARLITYYNRSAVRQRLECILDEFAFAPLADVLEAAP